MVKYYTPGTRLSTQQLKASFDRIPEQVSLQHDRVAYALDTGAANAYLVEMPNTWTVYTEGASLRMKAVNANTGAATINVDGLGVKTVTRANGDALLSGDIPAGSVLEYYYDGTNFQLNTGGLGVVIAGTGAFPFSGALVDLAADETTADYIPAKAVPFDAETYDIGGWHDNSTNNTRLTVPAGVTKVRVVGSLIVALTTTSDDFYGIAIYKNGAQVYIGNVEQRSKIATGTVKFAISSHVHEVVAGDYFELFFESGGDASVTVQSDRSSFSIQAIETTESGKTATVQTTDATATVIANGAMAADSAHTIRAYGQGREDATGDTYHFDLFGGARNEGGTSSAPAADVRSVEDAGVSSWVATLVANDSTDVWELKVTGQASHTIDWTVTYFEIIKAG